MIVYDVQGALFFGAVEQFKETMLQIHEQPKVFVLSLKSVLSVDVSGLHAIEDLMLSTRMRGIHFVVVGPHAQPYVAMERAGLLDAIGQNNVFASLAEVVADTRFSEAGDRGVVGQAIAWPACIIITCKVLQCCLRQIY